jgi:hypothetical protein
MVELETSYVMLDGSFMTVTQFLDSERLHYSQANFQSCGYSTFLFSFLVFHHTNQAKSIKYTSDNNLRMIQSFVQEL